jgi:RraA family protein
MTTGTLITPEAKEASPARASTTPKSAQVHPGPGFRIRKSIERPPEELVDEFRSFPTPDISDMLNRLYTMSSAIQILTEECSVAGPACTVKVYPGDNLMVHKALDIAQPGDILVVDAGGSTMNGIIGDLISTKAKHRGIAAFIIDGLIRDLPEVRANGLPVFARGVTPIGPLHRGPGEINFPVSCGGIVVNPGDIVVGDRNGITVVRKDFAREILDRLHNQRQALQRYEAQVRRGQFSNKWADDLLQDLNCTILE